ncbi:MULTISPECIES: aryl-sulfate sulfotransferase [Helcococcus]|uniref:Aryl-sulfate sulfotransferase n=1 Tax=Helcococcus bovis TaxID=3153252 RepID=A0ABW9F5X5_9FIRM
MAVKYTYKEHLITRQAKSEKKMLKEFREGTYTLEKPLIKYNPYLLNTLSAVILFRTEEATAITVRVKGKTEKADFYHTFPVSKEHILPIVGLYSDYENKIELYPYQKPNQKVTHTIKTPPVKGAELVERVETTPEYMQDNVMMLAPAVSDLAIAVDYAGDVRLDFSEALVWDIKRLPNGNFLMGSERLMKMPYFVSGIYELSAVGKIYKEYRIPHGYHHDQYTLPNGDIIALNCDIPNGTVEDMAVVIDRETGHVKKSYNFKNFIKPGSQKSGSWSDEDWFHCNAVWYDEHSNSLTFSGRHINAMVNIDFETGDLNWIISDPEGWPEEYQKYMFKPVGQGDFEWQYEQHANLITPLGDVMCFDNHHYGSQVKENYLAPNDSYSRGVKYAIDTEKMEIKQLWQYGKERGKEFFSPYICNVKYYNEGYYLTHSGGIAYDRDGNASAELGPFARIDDPEVKLKSITVETVGDKKEFELEVNSNYYRANKNTLYAKESGQNNLALGQGQLLGTLGVTPTMDVEIPTEDAGVELDDWHDAHITDEVDMLTFQAKFEPGTMVLLVLENEEESRQYFISTSKGKRGAMCTGTFLPDDDRETRTVVTKDGLDGEYQVKLIINDKKYDLGVKVRA